MAPRVDEQDPPQATDQTGEQDAPLDEHLLEPAEDRWRWRRRIRANPRQLRVYRAVVGLLGLVLVALGLATGWLPGPGGIPLVLLGLAVWASEFRWAHRLLLRLKRALDTSRGWPRRRRVGTVAAVVLGCALLAWAYLALVGPPAWVPVPVDRVLDHLPGVDIPA